MQGIFIKLIFINLRANIYEKKFVKKNLIPAPPPPKPLVNLAAMIKPSLILHFDIYPGGLQFRKISTVAEKYFDALPCFSHDMHATLSRNCIYINPNVPCLNVIWTNSMQNITF